MPDNSWVASEYLLKETKKKSSIIETTTNEYSVIEDEETESPMLSASQYLKISKHNNLVAEINKQERDFVIANNVVMKVQSEIEISVAKGKTSTVIYFKPTDPGMNKNVVSKVLSNFDDGFMIVFVEYMNNVAKVVHISWDDNLPNYIDELVTKFDRHAKFITNHPELMTNRMWWMGYYVIIASE